jgi:drug/metabolite transporter (DMT)-like permease
MAVRAVSDERLKVIGAFAAVWLVWGSTYLAIAWAVETIPPFLMIGARCVAAGSMLYGWGRLRGGPRPTTADWRAALVAGVLLFVTGQAGLAWAETRIPSGMASLLLATEPLFIAALVWRGGWLTGSAGRPLRPAGVVALLVGFGGVGVLLLPTATRSDLDGVGALVTVLVALSWSIGMFRAGSRPGMSAGQTAGMQLLSAGAVLVVLSALAGELRGFSFAGVTVTSWAAFAYLVAFGSVVTFGAYVWLIGRVHASHLATHTYVNPIVAVALGGVLNDEPVTATVLAASALILGSVAILLREGTAATSKHRESTYASRVPPLIAMRPASPGIELSDRAELASSEGAG